jgi:hypothetical protein
MAVAAAVAGTEDRCSVRQRTFYPSYHVYVLIPLVEKEWVFLI